MATYLLFEQNSIYHRLSIICMQTSQKNGRKKMHDT